MDLLAHMQVFVRIAEMRSLSRAARSLQVSLPTVSRQLRELEEQLGQSLVARTTRRLALTDAGGRLYDHSVRILRAVDEAKRAVAREEDVVGTVVISAPVTIGLTRISPGLSCLRARHPHLVVELRLEDHVADLVADGVDIAVRASTRRAAGSDTVARKVASWPNVLVAAPAYLRGHPAPQGVEALARHRLLAHVAADRRATVWRLARGGTVTTLAVRDGFRTNNILALRDLALQGEGIALLPEWLVAPALANGQLVRVLPSHEGHTTVSYLVHRRTPPPRVRAVLEVLAAILRGSTPSG